LIQVISALPLDDVVGFVVAPTNRDRAGSHQLTPIGDHIVAEAIEAAGDVLGAEPRNFLQLHLQPQDFPSNVLRLQQWQGEELAKKDRNLRVKGFTSGSEESRQSELRLQLRKQTLGVVKAASKKSGVRKVCRDALSHRSLIIGHDELGIECWK